MSGLPASYLPPRRYRGPYRVRRPSSGAEKAAAGVLLALVLVGGGAKVTTTVVHHHHHAAPRPAVASGTLDCTQLEQLWDAAGGNPADAFMAAEVATAESSGRQYAYLADSNGTADEGYWQINTSHGSLATYDPYGNARAAVIISRDGTNWWPWVTFDNNLEYGKC